MEKMNWYEAKEYMNQYNRRNNITTKGTSDKRCEMVAVISEDSFDTPYSLDERSYVFTNDNKAFMGAGGYSIFSNSLDGSDRGVRLEWYLEDEGNKPGWKVEYVYIKSED